MSQSQQLPVISCILYRAFYGSVCWYFSNKSTNTAIDQNTQNPSQLLAEKTLNTNHILTYAAPFLQIRRMQIDSQLFQKTWACAIAHEKLSHSCRWRLPLKRDFSAASRTHAVLSSDEDRRDATLIRCRCCSCCETDSEAVIQRTGGASFKEGCWIAKHPGERKSDIWHRVR